MKTKIDEKIHLYQTTVIFSLLLTLIGFSYNVWRMEASEENYNVRIACFELLINLSSLEQLIYSAHYDKDLKEGNPRKGWVVVGLIGDLSVLTNHSVEEESYTLKKIWITRWDKITTSRASVDLIVQSIDTVRMEIKNLLVSLE